MQLTFTVGRDTTPAEYRRLIAALVVLGEVTLEDAPVQPDLPLVVTSTMEGSHGSGPDVSNLSRSPFTAEELAEADRLVQAEQQPPPPPPPSDPEPDASTVGFGQPAPPPPPPEPADPDLDAAGVRWDARIHASTRAKLKGSNLWKPKRGVDPALVESVVAAQRHTATLEPKAPPAAPATGAAPPPPPPPPTDSGPAPTDAPGLIAWITRQGIESPVIEAACVAVGLVDANGKGSLPLIITRPDFVAALHAELSK